MTASLNMSLLQMAALKRVCTKPGAMALTWMLSGASSAARTSVSMSTAALLTQ